MRKILTPGVVAGLLAAGAVAAGLAGRPALAAFLSDPDTAAHVVTAAGAIGALVAGALQGVRAE
ncbi:hypothetical protein [Methylobacterium oryzihabitans]|uniref:Uncharacterized protein n=1 Tax=Methylobacterium oryzihabitans TaxID=2499852 RepID=A0A437P5K3_9HYPH|nr:hypothetical protein [Methylobacterium oryzihabitans]RVU17512.1 hypothetical protein EOE48_14080 [Methylobacterium oryzihabitans]